MKHEKNNHNYMKLCYILLLILVQKELSHMPLGAVDGKDKFAQSLRTDKKMFQSNEGQI